MLTFSTAAAAGLLLTLALTQTEAQSIPIELYSTLIPQRLLATAQNHPNPVAYPQWTTLPPYNGKEGVWQFYPTDTWTSGFFPASLMLLNERAALCPNGQMITTQDAATALSEGRTWSAPLTTLETTNHVKHDVGFVSFPFWEDLKLDPTNQTAITIVEAFGAYLAGRYNPTVGCTRSWDSPANATDEFEVIIDNMINIELFFVAGGLNGNSTYPTMAKSHADHTMANHVRPDGSTYHVVVYNSTDGSVIRRVTAQGYADDSTWSRGQAWAMYGFTSMYNRTGEQQYLDTARKVSQWYLDHLPTDIGVPYWDFNAPLSPTPPRDTSSATIASSALIFLSQLEKTKAKNATGSDYYLKAAINLLHNTVALGYRRESNWQSVLSNGTANVPANPTNYNTGLVYGDYYFIKAGNMLLDAGIANCSSGSGDVTMPTTSGGSSSGGGSNNSGASSSQRHPRSEIFALGTMTIVMVFAASFLSW